MALSVHDMMKAMKHRGLLTELWRARTIRIWTFSVCGLLLLAIGLLVLTTRSGQKDNYHIPQPVIEMANFTPYFYKGTIPENFTAKEADTSYVSNVLLIRLVNNKNQTVTMTQQALPQDLAASGLVGAESWPGIPGEVTFSSTNDRTTVTLFTADKKTMIILNTADAIETSTLKELLRSLTPLR
jgi:hypothetical protein